MGSPYAFFLPRVATFLTRDILARRTPMTLINPHQGNESRLTRLWLQRAESVQQVLRVPGGALAAALD